jgi:hypothetical protein
MTTQYAFVANGMTRSALCTKLLARGRDPMMDLGHAVTFQDARGQQLMLLVDGLEDIDDGAYLELSDVLGGRYEAVFSKTLGCVKLLRNVGSPDRPAVHRRMMS